ncbi:hypothetical protein BT67DRAFT_70331 [Trichocladium antarcticum]|uniref:Uncharacterized protein n=1 Tax=Trichocladium antarcticum TaxID=1450529 RepID=A0AAN6UHD1_9PEZI|nr:hypothetical protein BT67DRAFT_70331 [Trichocladium antarcticum]
MDGCPVPALTLRMAGSSRDWQRSNKTFPIHLVHRQRDLLIALGVASSPQLTSDSMRPLAKTFGSRQSSVDKLCLPHMPSSHCETAREARAADNMGRFDKHRLEPPSHHSLATARLGQLLLQPYLTLSRLRATDYFSPPHQLTDPLCLSGYFQTPFAGRTLSRASSNAARRTAGAPRLGALSSKQPYAPLHSDHPRESGNLMFQVWSQKSTRRQGLRHVALSVLFLVVVPLYLPPTEEERRCALML